MSIFINLLIIALILYAGYQGNRRGMVMIALELVSFGVATLCAMLSYQYVGAALKGLFHVATPLANVAGFTIVWALAELCCAVFIRLVIVPRIAHHIHLSPANRIGGSILGAFKAAALITLALIVFAGLPLSPTDKRAITDSPIPRLLLASSGNLQATLSTGLGRDLGESLNFFTVPAEPESEKRIDLGYTTTNVTTAPRLETEMLTLLNQERTTRGLPALTMNSRAREVARKYSAYMFAGGFFSHVDPHGDTPFDRMKAGGVEYGSAGENLALAPTLKQAHTGLMNSPGHKANILSREYRTVGIGIVDGGPYGIMVTQDFTD